MNAFTFLSMEEPPISLGRNSHTFQNLIKIFFLVFLHRSGRRLSRYFYELDRWNNGRNSRDFVGLSESRARCDARWTDGNDVLWIKLWSRCLLWILSKYQSKEVDLNPLSIIPSTNWKRLNFLARSSNSRTDNML